MKKSESQLQAELDALNAKSESQTQDLLLLVLARRDKRESTRKMLANRIENLRAEGCTAAQIIAEIEAICAAKTGSKDDDVHARIKADLIAAGAKYGLTEADFK